MGRVREEKRSEKRKTEKKEDADARARKVAIHCVFRVICVALEDRKVGSLKRRVQSHVVR